MNTPGRAASESEIVILKEVVLGQHGCVVDGLAYSRSQDDWGFYVPELHLRFLHALDGMAHCINPAEPSIRVPVARRAAERIVAAREIHAMGLGPLVRGIAFAHQFEPWYGQTTFTFGYVIEPSRWWKWKGRQATEMPPINEDDVRATQAWLERLLPDG